MNLPMLASKRWFANSVLLGVTAIWGATFTLTKEALQSIPVFPYLAARFILAALALFTMALVSPISRKSFQPRLIAVGVLLGLVLFGAYAFQTVGLQYTTPSAAGFLTGLSVVMVPLLGVPISGTRMHRRTLLGSLLATGGLILVTGIHSLQLHIGDIYVLVCAVFVALQILCTEKYGAECDSLALAAIEVAVLAICSTSVSVLAYPLRSFTVVWQSGTVLWAVLICALPATALAYWAQNAFQKLTSATETAVIFTMEPVFAAAIAALIAGDKFSAEELIGGVLILTGMLLTQLDVGERRVGTFSERL